MLCGCGRLGFEGVAWDGGGGETDATDGGNSGDPDSKCGPWSTPMMVEGFEDGPWERGPTQRADRREVMFARYEVVGSVFNGQLWGSARGSTSVPFGPEGSLVALNDPMGDDLDPSLSADGLVLMFTSNRTGMWQAFEARRPNVGTPFSPPVLAAGLESLAITGSELTSDGLGVYFSMGGRLWVARRATLGQNFQAPTELGFAGDGPSISADEREIYYGRLLAMFVRRRASVTDPFAEETELVVSGAFGTSAPELSQDGTELLIIVSDQLSRVTRTCD